MINVLQLAAGKGSRFKDYSDVPKPFIEVDGEPMFLRAFKSMHLSNVRYHVLFQEDHIEKYNPEQYVPDAIIHSIDHYTDGAATSAYSVIAYSPFKHEQWLIIDCDFILDTNVELPSTSGIVVQHHPWDIKSSYSYIDSDNKIKAVAEKQTISEYRNTGHYLWETGELFTECYEFYKNNKLTQMNEFYLSPLYNYAINKRKDVLPIYIDNYVPIGTPADLESYNEKRNTDI